LDIGKMHMTNISNTATTAINIEQIPISKNKIMRITYNMHEPYLDIDSMVGITFFVLLIFK